MRAVFLLLGGLKLIQMMREKIPPSKIAVSIYPIVSIPRILGAFSKHGFAKMLTPVRYFRKHILKERRNERIEFVAIFHSKTVI